MDNNKTDPLQKFYTLLDVPRDATIDEINRAFRKASLQCHPDKLVNVDAFTRLGREGTFKQLSNARDILIDLEAQAAYIAKQKEPTKQEWKKRKEFMRRKQKEENDFWDKQKKNNRTWAQSESLEQKMAEEAEEFKRKMDEWAEQLRAREELERRERMQFAEQKRKEASDREHAECARQAFVRDANVLEKFEAQRKAKVIEEREARYRAAAEGQAMYDAARGRPPQKPMPGCTFLPEAKAPLLKSAGNTGKADTTKYATAQGLEGDQPRAVPPQTEKELNEMSLADLMESFHLI